jgi:hypothetical protein
MRRWPEFVVLVLLAVAFSVFVTQSDTPASAQQKSLWGPTLRIFIDGTATLVSGNPSTVTVVFTPPLPVLPICVATNMTAAEPLKVVPTTTQVTITGSKNVTHKVAYICSGRLN